MSSRCPACKCLCLQCASSPRVKALPYLIPASALLLVAAGVFWVASRPEPLPPPEPEYELADPSCKDYLAIVGAPCSDGHWLHVSAGGRYTSPAAPVCECAVVQKGSSRS